MGFLKKAIFLLLVLCLVFVLDFWRRTNSNAVLDGGQVGVVFSGQHERIETGLALLQEGKLKGLIVSGVNGASGLSVGNFAHQFHLGPQHLNDSEGGWVILGPLAMNTLENAAETACLLQRFGNDRSLVLITSRYHMPRASVLLGTFVVGRQIERLTVEAVPASVDNLKVELKKYLMAVLYATYRFLNPAPLVCN